MIMGCTLLEHGATGAAGFGRHLHELCMMFSELCRASNQLEHRVLIRACTLFALQVRIEPVSIAAAKKAARRATQVNLAN